MNQMAGGAHEPPAIFIPEGIIFWSGGSLLRRYFQKTGHEDLAIRLITAFLPKRPNSGYRLMSASCQEATFDGFT
jgi:hypothetical protein